MSGLKYVGADQSTDKTNNTNDLLTKGDVDTQLANQPVTQETVSAQINTAVSGYATANSLGLTLNNYIQPNTLTAAGTGLVSNAQVGVASGICPLDSSGLIPPSFIPSLGTGYLQGPYPTTTTTSVTAVGSTPTQIATWALGPLNITYQPLVFMVVEVTGANGAQPVIDVVISSGAPASYSATASGLIARGKGRSQWNDVQAIVVMPFPASAGHTGVSGTSYATNYNTYVTAWVYDAMGQSVTVNSAGILSAALYGIRTQQ